MQKEEIKSNETDTIYWHYRSKHSKLKRMKQTSTYKTKFLIDMTRRNSP